MVQLHLSYLNVLNLLVVAASLSIRFDLIWFLLIDFYFCRLQEAPTSQQVIGGQKVAEVFCLDGVKAKCFVFVFFKGDLCDCFDRYQI